MLTSEHGNRFEQNTNWKIRLVGHCSLHLSRPSVNEVDSPIDRAPIDRHETGNVGLVNFSLWEAPRDWHVINVGSRGLGPTWSWTRLTSVLHAVGPACHRSRMSSVSHAVGLVCRRSRGPADKYALGKATPIICWPRNKKMGGVPSVVDTLHDFIV